MPSYPRASRRSSLIALALAAFGSHAMAPQAALGQDARAAAKPSLKATVKAKAADLPTKTFAGVPYGEHKRQVIDFWKAGTKDPAPLLVFIHGGGWMFGDKGAPNNVVDVKKLLDHGISVASINYRLVPQAHEAGVKPPLKWPLEDAARSIQFLRSKASEWNIDKARLAASGTSAGACSSLWLAFHDEMAKPDDPDPVARESTRLTCAAVRNAQTALDPRQTRAWMPNMSYGGHAFGFIHTGRPRDAVFQEFYDHRDEVLPWIKEYSPYELAGPGDPPIFLDYPNQSNPPRSGEEQKDPTHSAVNGLMLLEKLKETGVDARLSYPGHEDPDYSSITDYLIDHLKKK
jgi:acetyl esterase/lipase